MNLRKDHCRNLHRRTTREHVSLLSGGAASPLPPPAGGARASGPRRAPSPAENNANPGARRAKETKRTERAPGPRSGDEGASRLSRTQKRLSATDISALASMKNVAKCDTWCELQNPANHRVFERKLRPKPAGRGHVCLGVTHAVAPTLPRDARGERGAEVGPPCRPRRGRPKTRASRRRRSRPVVVVKTLASRRVPRRRGSSLDQGPSGGGGNPDPPRSRRDPRSGGTTR